METSLVDLKGPETTVSTFLAALVASEDVFPPLRKATETILLISALVSVSIPVNAPHAMSYFFGRNSNHGNTSRRISRLPKIDLFLRYRIQSILPQHFKRLQGSFRSSSTSSPPCKLLNYSLRDFENIYAGIKAISDQNGLNRILNFTRGGMREQMTKDFDAAINTFHVGRSNFGSYHVTQSCRPVQEPALLLPFS